MTAFTIAQMTGLQSNIENQAKRVLAHQAAGLALTHDEVLDMFAPPEHHHTLKTMKEVAYCYPSTSFSWNWCRAVGSLVSLMFEFRGDSSPAAPRVPNFRQGIRPDAEWRLNIWLEERITIGLDFGRVQTVLAALNEMCAGPKQVRFLWPTLTSLATGDNLISLRPKLAPGGPPPSHIPAIKPALRDAMERAAGVIASAALLGEPPADYFPEVSVMIMDTVTIQEEIGHVRAIT